MYSYLIRERKTKLCESIVRVLRVRLIVRADKTSYLIIPLYKWYILNYVRFSAPNLIYTYLVKYVHIHIHICTYIYISMLLPTTIRFVYIAYSQLPDAMFRVRDADAMIFRDNMILYAQYGLGIDAQPGHLIANQIVHDAREQRVSSHRYRYIVYGATKFGIRWQGNRVLKGGVNMKLVDLCDAYTH